LESIEAAGELVAQSSTGDPTELRYAGIRNPVQGPIALAAPPHQALAAQQAEVPRNVRLAEAGPFDELMHRSFPLYEEMEETKAGRVAEGAKAGRDQLQGVFVQRRGLGVLFGRHGLYCIDIFAHVNMIRCTYTYQIF
jgi:hypothetical protein